MTVIVIVIASKGTVNNWCVSRLILLGGGGGGAERATEHQNLNSFVRRRCLPIYPIYTSVRFETIVECHEKVKTSIRLNDHRRNNNMGQNFKSTILVKRV